MIIKLGGSFITFKREDGAPPYREDEANLNYRIREDWIREFARSIRDNEEPKIIVHGGGTHGHRTVTRWRSGLVKGKSPMMAWEVRWRMDQLTNRIVKVLGSEKVPAISVPSSTVITLKGGAIGSFYMEPLKLALERGCIPVLRGDLAPDIDDEWGVISGDPIIKYLCKHDDMLEMDVNRVIMLMDTDGFHDPVTGKKIGEINQGMFNAKKNEWEKAISSNNGDVTGGIFGKVTDCAEISSMGIEAFLIGGNVKDDMEAVLSGKRAGTRFPPAVKD